MNKDSITSYNKKFGTKNIGTYIDHVYFWNQYFKKKTVTNIYYGKTETSLSDHLAIYIISNTNKEDSKDNKTKELKYNFIENKESIKYNETLNELFYKEINKQLKSKQSKIKKVTPYFKIFKSAIWMYLKNPLV